MKVNQNCSGVHTATTYKWYLSAFIMLMLLFLHSDIHAFTLDVVGCNSNNNCTLPVSGFRWLLEEDNTIQSPPGVRVNNSIGLAIHNSHAPVVAKGSAAGSGTTITLPDNTKRYFISVLPDSGFTMSGTTVAAGETGAVAVKVHQYPVPSAQISIFVFKDHNPINNAPDFNEEGLANFSIILFDQAGQMSQDAFGNPLGTTYMDDGMGGFMVDMMGTGEITTDADGKALIKYLAPGKYGIRAVPPHNEANWVQTATIEGTPGIDAWVKANEPPVFIEGFGTGFHHVFIGFLNTTQLPWAVSPPSGGVTITGKNIYNHFGRPPVNQGFFEGPPVPECWVGLNDLASKQGLIAVPCDGNSNFTLNHVPPGTYQLVTWDKPLDALFGFNTIVVGNQNLNLGKVLSFRWFGTFKGSVFADSNQNGFRDPMEMGISNQNINLRFRDGSIYQTQPTDILGEYEFSEVFPFFKWLVAEVDFARFKATGMTSVVDYGGKILPHNGWIMPSFNELNPQPQTVINPNTGNNLSRTETGAVLLEAMMLFLNQTNVVDWGKLPYGAGENGGITGVVYYDVTRAENDPRYNAPESWEPGIPGVQINLYEDFDHDGAPDGPAVDTVYTDSWDDNKPTGCIQTLPNIPGVQPCFDNYGTWNQIRPGVFDGGYAFGLNLVPGTYIVEVIPPTGYEVVKEEDKNVDFGDEYYPMLIPSSCVGAPHALPQYLSLFPGQMIPDPSNYPYVPGKTAPLCNRKQVVVTQGKNAAADFYLFTEVPKAARVVGFVNNDLSAEFDPSSPVFGEKSSPSWIPVSYRDWQGNEVARSYTDEFGSYNSLLPSTFSVNIPNPTGVSPNLITAVLNHPLLTDGSIDPYYDPTYSVTPWTLDYWPGKTTYLDTPLVPVAAFAGFPQNGPDVEPADKTPVIKAVNGPANGPIVCNTPENVTITSLGLTQVPNPDFDPAVTGSQNKITRDYGFGLTKGSIKIGDFTVNPADIIWTDDAITITVRPGVATGQLAITRADNNRPTPYGITLHVSTNSCSNVVHVTPGPGTPIQGAIDAAVNGSIIIVEEGTYTENIILYKTVTLQGSGAGSTLLFANPSPAERLSAWHAKALSIYGSDPFAANEAPGIMVFGNVPTSPLLIDGFMIFGALAGGAIDVNNDTNNLRISNNRLTGNQGNWGAGITVGTPGTDSVNTNIIISNNYITKNGGVQGGGGISLYTGTDTYKVTNNYIGGNFSRFYGGGINHFGLSNDVLIEGNKILFNEVASGVAGFGDGAGIFIGGEPIPGALTPGAGNVKINANLIQGNLAGVGSGAGIRVLYMNGEDVAASPGNSAGWYTLNITNNMIVNNVAGYEGGGITLQDSVKANIINNSISNNDSTGTAANAFKAGSVNSSPQGAGVVSNAHSAGLIGIGGFTQKFSNPLFANNIIWNNRSFYTTNGGAGGLLPNPISPVWDLRVTGTAVASYLKPTYSILTILVPSVGGNYSGFGNLQANPLFELSYLNTLFTAAVIDEGGNFITVRFKPLMENAGNYHVSRGSPAINTGVNTYLSLVPADYDREPRPYNRGVDIGADEYATTAVTSSISGTVTTNGGPLSGVTITLSGVGNAVATTNASGQYSFTGLANGNYTITPNRAGYTFSPATANITVNNANVTHNFTATLTVTTYSISGTVSTGRASNFPASGVTITLTGAANATATTNALGQFNFTGLANGNYTVTPSQATLSFTPANRSVTVNNANVTKVNFTRN
jgi:large repetitive protein